MAIWKALSDLYIDAFGLLPTGTVFSDLPGDQVPQGCPTAYVPTPYMEPLNADAVAQFWAAGVQLPGGSVPLRLGRPATMWVVDPAAGPGNPYRQYVISGPLGAGLPMQQQIGTRGVYP